MLKGEVGRRPGGRGSSRDGSRARAAQGVKIELAAAPEAGRPRGRRRGKNHRMHAGSALHWPAGYKCCVGRHGRGPSSVLLSRALSPGPAGPCRSPSASAGR